MINKEEFEKAAQEAFRNAALEMKAFCADRWAHTPRDADGDFAYSACIKCYYDPFCTKFGLRNGESAGPCDWKITHTRGPRK
jgi:hypothetical protein